jgi:hypothetical protein
VNRTYDIFRGDPGDSPIWIEAIQGLRNAKDRIVELCDRHPGEYFVFDSVTAKVVNVLPSLNTSHQS